MYWVFINVIDSLTINISSIHHSKLLHTLKAMCWKSQNLLVPCFWLLEWKKIATQEKCSFFEKNLGDLHLPTTWKILYQRTNYVPDILHMSYLNSWYQWNLWFPGIAMMTSFPTLCIHHSKLLHKSNVLKITEPSLLLWMYFNTKQDFCTTLIFAICCTYMLCFANIVLYCFFVITTIYSTCSITKKISGLTLTAN